MADVSKLFYSNYGTDDILRSDLDGSNVENVITSGLNKPTDIVYNSDDDKIYWTEIDGDIQGVERANCDGSNREILLSGWIRSTGPWGGYAIAPWGIDLSIASGYMFLTEEAYHTVWRMGIDIPSGETPGNRTDVEPILSGVAVIDSPISIAVDNQNSKLYIVCRGEWAPPQDIQIIRCNFDGSDIEQIIGTGTMTWPMDIELDVPNNKMYWTDLYGTPAVYRADLDGSNQETIISSGLTNPWGLALDTVNDELYFTDYGDGTILKCNFDGSNIQTIHSGLNDPVGLEIIMSSEEGTSASGTAIIHGHQKMASYWCPLNWAERIK